MKIKFTENLASLVKGNLLLKWLPSASYVMEGSSLIRETWDFSDAVVFLGFFSLLIGLRYILINWIREKLNWFARDLDFKFLTWWEKFVSEKSETGKAEEKPAQD